LAVGVRSTRCDNRTPSARLFLFLVPIRRPRCSTLFPYTTLFRSIDSCLDTISNCSELGGQSRSPPRDRSHGVVLHTGEPRLDLIDRKSTRLNSSHVKISYAVFCLKKKNRSTCTYSHRW